MRKFSRRHGWMRLRTFASGDGSVSFAWTEEGGARRRLPEPVTESVLAPGSIRKNSKAPEWTM